MPRAASGSVELAQSISWPDGVQVDLTMARLISLGLVISFLCCVLFQLA